MNTMYMNQFLEAYFQLDCDGIEFERISIEVIKIMLGKQNNSKSNQVNVR